MTATLKHIEVKQGRDPQPVDFLVTPIDVEDDHLPVRVEHDVEHHPPSLSELLHGR